VADYEVGLTYLHISTFLYFTFLPKPRESLKNLSQNFVVVFGRWILMLREERKWKENSSHPRNK
jgi:hypothetical protein